jgi:hypothetical protein
VTVQAQGEALRLAQGPELQARLEHWHYDTWKAAWDMDWVDPVFARFGLDAGGRPSRLYLGGLADPPEEWAEYARRPDKE